MCNGFHLSLAFSELASQNFFWIGFESYLSGAFSQNATLPATQNIHIHNELKIIRSVSKSENESNLRTHADWTKALLAASQSPQPRMATIRATMASHPTNECLANTNVSEENMQLQQSYGTCETFTPRPFVCERYTNTQYHCAHAIIGIYYIQGKLCRLMMRR